MAERPTPTEPDYPNDEQHIYIAIGLNVWGKGFTRSQAVDAMCSQGYSKRAKRLLYATTDPWAYIDEMGSLVHTEQSTYRLVERFGK